VTANPELRESWGKPDSLEASRAELDQVWRHFGAASTPEDFCRSWLALQCHYIAGVHDGVVVLQRPGSETFAPLAFWPEGRRDRSHLTEITERALREGRGLVQPRLEGAAGEGAEQQTVYQIAYPVRVDGNVRGVIGLDLAWRDEVQLQATMRQLQWGAGWLELLLRRVADPMEAARLRIKLILQFVATFVERETFKDAATALVTALASELGADRVVLGVMRGKSLQIEAVSHAVQFDRHANLLNATAGAMTEGLDQREPVVYPPDRDGRLVVTFAHAELAQMTGAGGIVTLPLLNEGRQVGALTLERAPGHRFDAPSVELLEGLAALLGPVIQMKLAGERSLPVHASDSARSLWAMLVGPRHHGFKFGVLVVAAIVLFLSFADGVYRVSANARIEGEIQRAVTAPFQGYVRETSFRAGDTVKAGQVLARLDDRDLRLEQVRLRAQRDQHSKQFREAMAERNRAKVRLIASQIEQVEAQLALVEEQLSRTEITAPFDGILVSGDLTQVLGAPLERGQVLFEIAPLQDYRVVLQVDERSIGDVRVGQRGELVLSSMPGQRFPVVVKKVTPVSTAKDGKNFFRVESDLGKGADARLRPGMEGVAKIEAGERRLIWIWTRELVNWIRLKLWAWMP
jgi:biotin carboxyl carrier protein